MKAMKFFFYLFVINEKFRTCYDSSNVGHFSAILTTLHCLVHEINAVFLFIHSVLRHA